MHTDPNSRLAGPPDPAQTPIEKTRTGLNIPARALLEALKKHYTVSAEALSKVGISNSILSEKEYIHSLLSKNMDDIFDILSQCEPCSEYVQKVLIDDIDIDDIPHQFILESIRQRAHMILTTEYQKQ
jgi:hypothetical protein